MSDPNVLISVWIVEDHKIYGERLLRALNRMAAIQCQQRFTSCEAVLEILHAENAPQVLLLDVELPGLNGIEALAYFRRQAPRTALILLTVFEDDDKIFRAICNGATGYLLKTATIEDIASAIRSAAAGGSPITPTIARRVLDMFSKANLPNKDYGLTPREKEILQLLVQGQTTKSAAATLGISYYTADEYIRAVYEKLQVRSRGSAVAKAIHERLT